MSTIFRDVVTKAIDLFVKKQSHFDDFPRQEDDIANDVEDEDNWNTVIEDTGDGPHDTELCQMCQFLRKPCIVRRKNNK